MQRAIRRAAIAALLAAGGIGAAHAAAETGLDPVERRIVAEVRAGAPQALALLQKSVLINSGTMNLEGVRAVGQLFREQFDALGFATRWIDLPPEMQRAGHLVATRDGRRGKRLLLLGHLDTVFEPGNGAPTWERQGDGRVRGQGVSDMKGGDVIVVAALRALQRAGALDDTRIAVMFTGDEEEAGNPKSLSRGDMVALARRSDAALSFEGNVVDKDGRPTATVGRRATAGWTLEVTGRQGHSMAVFGANGYGAVYEAARILDAFRREVAEPGLTFNPGFIVGGTETAVDAAAARGSAFGKTNVIAAGARVEGDLRYLDYAQRDRAHARMRAIVAQHLPGTDATIAFHDSYPPMAVTPGNLALLATYSRASEDAGLGAIAALPAEARGAGDIQFVAPFVASLDGLGASGNGAHSPAEDLEPDSIERGAIRAALLIYRLTR
ncbi:M20/M25/M40 family metallo-hydrolase [uncultured Massilia sp.]|uniref:M20/M25/M40 family metallo-hydrolase n=1 Tax=uncultured Massilia sp. TaxID=169973 RepID=UPI0025FDA265|nr:M20/M25/M40 family metallo-hydrolase [uncultured Massilia sp.]